MNKRHIGVLLLLAICASAYTLAYIISLARRGEARQSVVVLADCYRFVFAHEIDRPAPAVPFTIPKALSEMPGWTEHVENTVDPALRPLYHRIDWHPPEDLSEGKEIASIELPHYRAVVLMGGAAYYIKKR